MITEQLINGPYKAMFKETYRDALAVLDNEQAAEKLALEKVLSHALLSCADAKREMQMVESVRDQFGIPLMIDLSSLPRR